PAGARPATARGRPLVPADRRAPLVVHDDWEPPEPSPVLTATGPAALLLGGAALTCAFVPSLTALALPLCVLRALAGVAGALVDDGTQRSRLVPAGAAAVCGVLLAALVVPGFGPGVPPGRAGAVDPMAIRVVPLTGDSLDPGADEDGWADASRAAVQ